jgi:hypothetical protein
VAQADREVRERAQVLAHARALVRRGRAVLAQDRAVHRQRARLRVRRGLRVRRVGEAVSNIPRPKKAR